MLTTDERTALHKIIEGFLFPKEKNKRDDLAYELIKWDIDTKNLLVSCLDNLSGNVTDPQQEMLDLLLVLKNIDLALSSKNPKTANLVKQLEKTLGITQKNLLTIPKEEFSKENSLIMLKGLRACEKLVNRPFDKAPLIGLDILFYDRAIPNKLYEVMQKFPQFYQYAELLYVVCDNSSQNPDSFYFYRELSKRLSDALDPNNNSPDMFSKIFHFYPNTNYFGYPEDDPSGVGRRKRVANFSTNIMQGFEHFKIASKLYKNGWFRDGFTQRFLKKLLEEDDLVSAYELAKLALDTTTKHSSSGDFPMEQDTWAMRYFIKYCQNHPRLAETYLEACMLDLSQYFIARLQHRIRYYENSEFVQFLTEFVQCLTGFFTYVSSDFLYNLLIAKEMLIQPPINNSKTLLALCDDLLLELHRYFLEKNETVYSKKIGDVMITRAKNRFDFFVDALLDLQTCLIQQNDPDSIQKVGEKLVTELEKIGEKEISDVETHKRYGESFLKLQDYFLTLGYYQFTLPNKGKTSQKKYDLFLISWNGMPNLKILEETTLTTNTPLLIQGYDPQDKEKKPLYWIFKLPDQAQPQLAQLNLNKTQTKGLIFRELRKIKSSDIPDVIFDEIASKTNDVTQNANRPNENPQKIQNLSKRIYILIKSLFGKMSPYTQKAAISYASELSASLANTEEVILRSEWLTILFDTGDANFISTQVSGYLHPQTWRIHPDTNELHKLAQQGLESEAGPLIITVYLMKKIKDPLNPELKTTKEIKEQKEVKKTPPGKNFNVSDLVDFSSVYENPNKSAGTTTDLKNADKNPNSKIKPPQ